ncbi:MAG: hypothetical protein HC834_03325 [Rhodospirillales bacterium]|nr:hypothetical protein [Rhodospirillales bacterium]
MMLLLMRSIEDVSRAQSKFTFAEYGLVNCTFRRVSEFPLPLPADFHPTEKPKPTIIVSKSLITNSADNFVNKRSASLATATPTAQPLPALKLSPTRGDLELIEALRGRLFVNDVLLVLKRELRDLASFGVEADRTVCWELSVLRSGVSRRRYRNENDRQRQAQNTDDPCERLHDRPPYSR